MLSVCSPDGAISAFTHVRDALWQHPGYTGMHHDPGYRLVIGVQATIPIVVEIEWTSCPDAAHRCRFRMSALTGGFRAKRRCRRPREIGVHAWVWTSGQG